MTRRQRLAGRWSLVAAALVLGVGFYWALHSRSRAQEADAPALSVFTAPSHVPVGESWVLIGSLAELPEDAEVAPLEAAVEVLELQRLSAHALAARILVAGSGPGSLLEVRSESRRSAAYPLLFRGQGVPALSQDANFSQDDLIQGQLIVGGRDFVYAYQDGTDVPLAAVRIHNRATGRWEAHEIQREKLRRAEEAPVLDLDPTVFVEVDPLETLPDTDGDGVYDFDEAPEAREPTPGQLGVALRAGLNLLDLVTVDEAGNASWRLLEVFSTAVEEGGF